MNYYLSFSPEDFFRWSDEIEYTIRRYAQLISITSDNEDNQFSEEQENIFNNYIQKMVKLTGVKAKQIPIKTSSDTLSE